MNHEELNRIITKYLLDLPLTEKEKQLFQEWDDLFEKNPGLLQSLTNQEISTMQEQLWQNIQSQTDTKVISMQHSSFRRWARRIAVAVVFILVTGGVWFLIEQQNSKQAVTQNDWGNGNDIMPGGDKAVLTLAGGSTVQLSRAKNGTLAIEGNTTIVKLDNGQIAYKSGTDESDVLKFNTITTPVGGQFKVVLPDGSKVTLNAGSSLSYPVRFSADERKVTLTGEAYFEIAHNNSWPFKVNVKDMEVHDLGTEFNINVYSDEPVAQTTLVEGLASVKNSVGAVQLTPGKAAKVKGGFLHVEDIDIAEAIAWKNGLFQFVDADVESIMRQIARWYDVEIVYEKMPPGKQITGKAFRNSTLAEMLKILELSDIHFRIIGRKILVAE